MSALCCHAVVLSFCRSVFSVFSVSLSFCPSLSSVPSVRPAEKFWAWRRFGQDPGENKIEDRSDMGLVVRCNARECKEQCQVSVSSVRPCQCDIRIGLDG